MMMMDDDVDDGTMIFSILVMMTMKMMTMVKMVMMIYHEGNLPVNLCTNKLNEVASASVCRLLLTMLLLLIASNRVMDIKDPGLCSNPNRISLPVLPEVTHPSFVSLTSLQVKLLASFRNDQVR